MSEPSYSRLDNNVVNKNVTTTTSNGTNSSDQNAEESTEEEVPSISFFTLFRYATKKDKFCIFIAALSSVAGGCLTPLDTIIFSNLIQSMVDYGTRPDEESFLKAVMYFSIFSCAIGLGHILVTYLSTVLMNTSAANQIFRIRREYVKAALSQDFEYYDTHQTGDVASKLNDDMRKIEDGIGEKITTTIYYLSSFLSMVVMTLIMGWKLALICLSTFPLTVIIFSISDAITSRLTKKEREAAGKAAAIADEVLNAIRTVYAFSGQRKEQDRYQAHLKDIRKINIKKGFINGIAYGLMYFAIFASYALSYWVGYNLMQSEPGNYNVANTIAIFYGSMTASENFGMSSMMFEVFSMASGAGAKIFHLIDNLSTINPLKENINCHTLDDIEGNIELKDVVFHYPSRPNVPVLRGINLTIKRGQSVALVGHSGCGKSTIVQLISRYYDVIEGSVTIDEFDVRDIQVGWLRAQIGLVGQEPVLFNTTVRENIRYGRNGATDMDIESAARQANAHHFIMKLPKGYDTLVGERGASLSGGQKQRIAIARALVRNPTILLLDEATSALDSYSEAKVQKALDKAREGRTTIVVAHRLSTIRNVDVIYVLEQGKIVEMGSHDELMDKKGNYYDMVIRGAPLAGEDDISNPTSPSKNTEEEIDSEDDAAAELLSRRIRSSTISEDNEKASKFPFWQVVSLNAPEWKSITLASIATLIDGFTWPILGVVLGNFVGVLSNPNKEEVLAAVKLYCIIFLGTGGIAGVLNLITTFFYSIAGEYLTERLRKLMFENFLQQEMAYFDDKNNSVGAIGARLAGDASAVQGATGQRIGVLVNAFGALIFALIMSLYYEWRVGLVSFTLVPLMAAVVYQEGKMVNQNSFLTVNAMERSSKIAVEAVSQVRTVASLGREEQFLMEYCAELLPALVIAKRNAHWRGVIYGFSRGLNSFIYAGIMYFGGYLITHRNVHYSYIITSAESLLMGAGTLGSAFAWAPNFQEGLLAAGRIIVSLNKKSTIVDPDAPAVENFEGTGEVSFEKVNFSYPSRPLIKVLNNFDLKVDKGKTVALVGESGCGKSTVVQLIERYYDPNHGKVTQDNIPLPELRLFDVRKTIGFVQQEPVLFDRTIGENIAYGDNSREPSMDEIIEAAKEANIHQFVAALPSGYDTNVGSKGTQLSGGQKQRIAIARALIKKPKLLLLDEATSALDNESEQIVQEALDRAKTGRACVVIAHRLSTVRDADRICVVREGRVAESGTHAELMAMKGLYYSLSLRGQM